MKFDAILFDCDGVLVDSEMITNQVICNTLNAYGATISVEETITIFLGKLLRDSVEQITKIIGYIPPESFFNDFLLARDKALAERVSAIPNILHFVAAIQRANILFAVASGADLHKMAITLGRTGLLPAFKDRMFGKDNVACSKPAPDVYLLAAKTIGVDITRCVIIEDTVTGVMAGVAAGATVIGYAGAQHTNANNLLDAGACTVIQDITALYTLFNIPHLSDNLNINK
jgi:HAD superfamily hydrolase (TIGR01509 family)